MEMKGGAKTRGKGGRLLPLHRATCSSSSVLVACAVFFALGWLRGTLVAPPAPASPSQQAQAQAGAGAGGDAQAQKGADAGAARGLHEEEGESVTLPLFQPYAFGETGQSQIEHIQFQQLSWKPRAYIFPGFADAEKCDAIVALARARLAPSGLALRAGEKEEDQAGVRTSSGTFLTGSEEPTGALEWVQQKMARVTGLPVENGEAFNVLRYRNGQQYQAHMDTFDPKEFGPQATNRVASFLLYLTDVEEGGETVFPQENGVTRTSRFDECVGLKVKPRKGDALLFWSMTPDRKIDANALHAGCPVIKGEKWVATKWIRDGNGM